MTATVKQYAYHYQDPYRERAQDNRFDLQFRLFCLANGYHRRNGHATFERGQIASILGISATQVSNVIAKAKELGLIDDRSCSRCLIVPPHAINYGPGDANEPCGYCEGKRSTRRKPRNAAARPMGPRTAGTSATGPYRRHCAATEASRRTRMHRLRRVHTRRLQHPLTALAETSRTRTRIRRTRMPAVKTRVSCPHCGRKIALRHDTGAICGHGPHHRRCPGSSLTPVNGPLTERQMEFARHCYRTGDALPVERMLGVEYPQPALDGLCLDHALDAMTTAAQTWIHRTIMERQEEETR